VKLTAVFIYGVLFVFSLLISSSLWHWQMQNAYFVSHRAPMADFFPPFIHPGQSGNFYIRPARVIYAIWFVYLAATVLAPAAGAWLLFRLRQRALDNAWL
jgi:hypothetical protein